jgi:hypothetical protein
MGTLEDEIRTRLSRLTQNKIEYEDLWDFGENDGLDENEFSDEGEPLTPPPPSFLSLSHCIHSHSRIYRNYSQQF